MTKNRQFTAFHRNKLDIRFSIISLGFLFVMISNTTWGFEFPPAMSPLLDINVSKEKKIETIKEWGSSSLSFDQKLELVPRFEKLIVRLKDDTELRDLAIENAMEVIEEIIRSFDEKKHWTKESQEKKGSEVTSEILHSLPPLLEATELSSNKKLQRQIENDYLAILRLLAFVPTRHKVKSWDFDLGRSTGAFIKYPASPEGRLESLEIIQMYKLNDPFLEGMGEAIQIDSGDVPKPCEILCDLVRTANHWFDPRLINDPVVHFNPSDDELAQEYGHLHGSLRTILILFMFRSSPYCKEAKDWSREYLEGLKAPLEKPDTSLDKQHEKWNALITILKDSADPKDLIKAETFLSMVGQETKEQGAQNSYSGHALGFWLQAYPQMVALSETMEEGRPMIKQNLELLFHQRESWLREFLGARKVKNPNLESSKSIYNTFQVATGALSLSSLNEKFFDHFPTDLTDEHAAYRTHRMPSEPGFAGTHLKSDEVFDFLGRELPVRLVHYRKTKNPRTILRAVREFAKASPLLMVPIGANITHSQLHDIAPYYYHAVIPYFFSATSILKTDKNIDDTTKKELTKLEEKVYRQLLSLKDSEGRYRTLAAWGDKRDLFRKSQLWVYPFIGLAIMPLIRECKNTPVPTRAGILDFDEFLRFRTLGENLSPAQKEVHPKQTEK